MAPVVRRCACGGRVDAGGECEECRKKRLTLQRSASVAAAALAPAVGHSFANVRVHAEPRGEEVLNDTMGSSRCNLEGSAPSTTNSNPSCTRPCTALHEAQHVSDWGPCCARARAAFQAPGADQAAVRTRWNTYLETNRPWFECQAYGRSVTCADAMHTALLCGAPARVMRWLAMGAGAVGGGVLGAQVMGAQGAAVGAGTGLLGGPLAPATVPAGATAGFVTGEVLGFLSGLGTGAAAGAAADALREQCCRHVREYRDNSVRGRTINCDRAGRAPTCPF
jgi:hypothetical protein